MSIRIISISTIGVVFASVTFLFLAVSGRPGEATETADHNARDRQSRANGPRRSGFEEYRMNDRRSVDGEPVNRTKERISEAIIKSIRNARAERFETNRESRPTSGENSNQPMFEGKRTIRNVSANESALEDRLNSEVEDASWTSESTEFLSDIIRAADINAQIEQVKCAETICRAEIVFDNLASAAKMKAYAGDPTSDVRFFQKSLEGENFRIVLYSSRPGEVLEGIN